MNETEKDVKKLLMVISLIAVGIVIGGMYIYLQGRFIAGWNNSDMSFVLGLIAGVIITFLSYRAYFHFKENESEQISHINYLTTILSTQNYSNNGSTTPYPKELDIALNAWQAVSTLESKIKPKARIRAWLDERYTDSQLSNDAKERICIVANWDKTGGATRTY